jgi:outer membrane lipopolysaccharide assembly protein LptE/RlpB
MRFLALGLVLLLGGCGYHVEGHSDLLPSTLKTIYVPAWTNATVKFKLTDTLPQDITREFIARTKYKIVTQPDGADAVLTGTVLKYRANPAIFDPATSRASVVEFEVAMSAKLTERVTGKTLWENGYMTFKQRYEISSQSTAYFEESDPAVTRLSREAARALVSAILSNF